MYIVLCKNAIEFSKSKTKMNSQTKYIDMKTYVNPTNMFDKKERIFELWKKTESIPCRVRVWARYAIVYILNVLIFRHFLDLMLGWQILVARLKMFIFLLFFQIKTSRELTIKDFLYPSLSAIAFGKFSRKHCVCTEQMNTTFR